LSSKILISLFLIRVVAALVSGYFNLYLIPFSDSLGFHQNGIAEYHLLFNNPGEYFTKIFRDTRGND
jgi:hypothetical protein